MGDTSAYAAMVTVQRLELAVAVQAAAGKLKLRAVAHAGVIALTKCPLDVRSLQALLQAGR